MAHSRRPKTNSAASISSRQPTSTRPSSSPPVFPPLAKDLSKFARSWHPIPKTQAGGLRSALQTASSTFKLERLIMPMDPDAIAAIYRAESGKVLATLIRLLNDFDLAEEGL